MRSKIDADWTAEAQDEALAVVCADYFKENERWYTRKSRWKKILLSYAQPTGGGRSLTLELDAKPPRH